MFKTTGQRLKETREEKNISISELAAAAEVSEAVILSLENDEASPTIDEITSIAFSLGISVNNLMTGLNDPE